MEGFSGGILQRDLIKSEEYSRGIQLKDPVEEFSRRISSIQRDSAEEFSREIQWRDSVERFSSGI